MATQSLILASKLEVFYRYFFHFVGSKYSSLYFASEVPFALPRAFNQKKQGGQLNKLLSLSHGKISQDGHCARRTGERAR